MTKWILREALDPNHEAYLQKGRTGKATEEDMLDLYSKIEAYK
jgi:hypothetical protein